MRRGDRLGMDWYDRGSMKEGTARAMLAERLRFPPAGRVIEEGTVVLSIREEYARLILAGRKRVEFRRRFGRGMEGMRVYFYVTEPVGEIRLTARIGEVCRDEVRALWRRFGAASGARRSMFMEYFDGLERGVALVLEDVRSVEVGAKELERVGFVAPRSLVRVAAGSALARLLDQFPMR